MNNNETAAHAPFFLRLIDAAEAEGRDKAAALIAAGGIDFHAEAARLRAVAGDDKGLGAYAARAMAEALEAHAVETDAMVARLEALLASL